MKHSGVPFTAGFWSSSSLCLLWDSACLARFVGCGPRKAVPNGPRLCKLSSKSRDGPGIQNMDMWGNGKHKKISQRSRPSEKKGDGQKRTRAH
eukprot:4608458-Amphidinium_carterae.1